MTLRKLWNAVQLTASYYLSRMIRKPVQWGLPLRISVEPTTACNLRCPQCPSGLRSFKRPTGHLDMDQFYQWIPSLSQHTIGLNFYFQGEPFLHPEMCAAIRHASRLNFFTSSSTNGHFLNAEAAEAIVDSGLDMLTISIDGTDQETYERYRVGGKLQKALEGAEHLVNAKRKRRSRTPHVIFQFILFRHNVHQMEEARSLAAKIGFDEIRFKTAQVYDYEGGSHFIPEQAVYARYLPESNGAYVIRNKLYNHCFRLWNAPVVTWDGRVLPCCFDKDGDHAMGTMQGNNFAEIWKGTTYRAFRAQLLSQRKSIDICRNCTEGTRVWL